MKVLLVNPPPRSPNPGEPFRVPPLGLAYVAGALEVAGIEVQVLDGYALQMSWAEFEAAVERSHPDLVGVTGMSPVIDRTLQALAIGRRHSRYTVLGGPHATAHPQEAMEASRADFVVCGEGEDTLVELVRVLERGGEGLEQVQGLAHRQHGRTILNPPRPPRDDLDALPRPAYHLLPLDHYRYPLARYRRVATLVTSRGCPYRCLFCEVGSHGSLFRRTWRGRSPENVVAEVADLYRRFGIRSFVFYDDLFVTNRRRVLDICRLLVEERLPIEWKCEGRVNLVDEEMLAAMKRAGCRIIAYGVESGVQKNLDFLRKQATLAQIENALALTRRAGIRTLAYFILGIPGETRAEAEQTIDFAIRLDPDYAQFALLRPWPGTDLWTLAEQNGWLREIDTVVPLGAEERSLVALSGSISEADLRDIMRQAYLRFNFRPRYVLRRFLAAQGANELLGYARFGLKYLRWARPARGETPR